MHRYGENGNNEGDANCLRDVTPIGEVCTGVAGVMDGWKNAPANR